MKKPLWRDGWLMAICIGRIFMYMNYMVYAACLPILKSEWGMSATQAGSIASGFMIGYAASLAVALAATAASARTLEKKNSDYSGQQFGGTPPPAHTLVTISRLAWPAMIVEIDVTAVVPIK